MLFGSWPLLAALSVIDVQGEALCPAPAEVNAELANMLAVPETARLAERAIVTRTATAITIVLEAPDGARLGERELPVQGSCEAQARAVAVVLAAWITDAHPEYVRSLPDAAGAAQTPGSSPQPEPQPAPLPAQPPPPPPRSAVPVAPRTAPEPPNPDRVSARRVSLGVAAGASVSRSAAMAAIFSAGWLPAETGFGATGFAGLITPRVEPLGSGEVQWRRWPLGAGPAWRWRGGSLALDLALGAVAGWLRVDGLTFANANGHDQDVSVGSFAGARLGGARGVFRPFVASTALLWLRGATAVSTAPAAERDLPPFELLFVAGVDLAP